MLDTASARDSASPVEATQPVTRARVRFRKEGDLRFLGHQDLINCLERMCRRAELTLLTTRGFNPRPRLTFALSLALGIIGKREVMEFELAGTPSPEDILSRLNAHAPPGLHFDEIRLMGPRDKARVSHALYRVNISAARRDQLPEAIQSLLAADHCWVERRRPQPRKCDIRPFIDDLRCDNGALAICCHVSPDGTARPDDILRLLGLGDLVGAGILIERSDLLLVDENSAKATTNQELRYTGRLATELPGPEPSLEVNPPPRPPRPASLLPGPFSFDS
ncbi:MAG: DUF2344 domain-containing protein [Planctomycetes bacterium]|nr:DUF2344 domain-containing protein [Planctomycetota bacterium]